MGPSEERAHKYSSIFSAFCILTIKAILHISGSFLFIYKDHEPLISYNPPPPKYITHTFKVPHKKFAPRPSR